MYEKIRLKTLYSEMTKKLPNLKVTRGVQDSFKTMKLMEVPSDKIVIDRSFQREVVEKNLKKICNNFDVKKIKPILCFKDSSDSYYIYDGQHTSLACIHNGITNIPGFVYESSNDLSSVNIEELGRELFKSSNTNNEKISTYDRFKAKLSDKDPTIKYVANDILKICNDNKVTMGSTNPENKPLHIVKVGHIEKTYKKYGRSSLEKGLKFIIDVLPNDKISEDWVNDFSAIFYNIEFNDTMLSNLKSLLLDNDKLNIKTFQHSNNESLMNIIDRSSESYTAYIERFRNTPSKNSDLRFRMQWMLVHLYNEYYPDQKINIDAII